MNPLSAVKDHPKLFAGVAVGAILLVVVLKMGSGGSQAVASAPGGSSVDSANQLQGTLAGIQGQIQLAQIAAQANKDNAGAAIQAAEIQANTTNAANTLAAQIASLQLTTQAQTQQQYNTLQSEVINKQTDAQVQMAQISSNTTIESGKTIADALVAQSHDQAQSAVGVAQASRPCSSYLFGLISSC